MTTVRWRLTVAAALATALGCAALVPLFAYAHWLVATGGAITLVAGAGALGRRLRLPAALVSLLSAGLLLGYLTRIIGGGYATIIPTGRTIARLHPLLGHAVDDIRTLVPPIQPNHGIELLTVAGVGAVALVVDLIAVGLHRPALAGLPLLGLFAVPSAIAAHGVGWVAFTVAAAGYLGLLVADARDRLGRWGRVLGRSETSAPHGRTPRAAQTAPVAAAGRRLGAAALGLAVVVPVLIPGLRTGLAVGGGTGVGGSGNGSTVTTFNPIVRLRDELDSRTAVPLLRVRTDAAQPGYLRMTALDQFDGSTWSASALTADTNRRVSHGVPAVPGSGQPSATLVHDAITVARLDVRWLPAPYPLTAVQVGGDWRFDVSSGTVFSTRATTQNLSYRVTGLAVDPSRERLENAPAPPASLDGFLSLPGGIPTEVSALTQRITARARTSFDKAVALQSYFHSPGFSYDTTVPQGNGDNALVAFLRAKRGFCEQYASAMAVMARLAGIPARVAIGFTAGTRQRDGSYLVTTHDAHAWPELYFAGAGWLQFEPTPLSGGRAVLPSYSVPAVAGSTAPGSQGATGPGRATGHLPKVLVGHGLQNLDVGGSALGPAPTPAGTNRPGRGSDTPLEIVGALLLAGLLAPASVRRLTRRQRWRRVRSNAAAPAHSAWAELTNDLRDLGLSRQPNETPRRLAARLEATPGIEGPARNALRRITTAEESARYATPERQDADGSRSPGSSWEAAADAALRDSVTVRRALYAAVPVGRRLRAALLPPSTGRWVDRFLETVGAATDQLQGRRERAAARFPGHGARSSPTLPAFPAD
ncbi:MAG TPA: DUF3488 and transglutaminase-like domain-containing protein [Mycobacteriales bacterium]|nr:DUF3488 and transglutaminase-like domain-containing protein [Mycobacteriales bacterium]